MAVQLDEFGMVVPYGNSGGGGGGELNSYRCADVDTTNQTWSGYKAFIDASTGRWSFASTVTTGLSYTSRLIPIIGNVYDENCTFIVTKYNDGIPTNGLIRYARLNSQIGFDKLGNKLSYQGRTHLRPIKESLV